MRHLELIMSDKNGWGADDVRALLSDHLEGTLDKDVQQQVDLALKNDPQLARERAALEQTVSLLRALPRSDAPEGLVGKVRDRLAAERRQAGVAANTNVVIGDNVVELAPRRRWGFEIVAGLAAVAAVVAIVVVGVPSIGGGGGDAGGMMTAGAASSSAVSLSWRAPGVARSDVVELATAAGLVTREDGSFTGDRNAAARFLVQLKTRAATAGSDVSGQVPEAAEAVVIVVVP